MKEEIDTLPKETERGKGIPEVEHHQQGSVAEIVLHIEDLGIVGLLIINGMREVGHQEDISTPQKETEMAKDILGVEHHQLGSVAEVIRHIEDLGIVGLLIIGGMREEVDTLPKEAEILGVEHHQSGKVKVAEVVLVLHIEDLGIAGHLIIDMREEVDHQEDISTLQKEKERGKGIPEVEHQQPASVAEVIRHTEERKKDILGYHLIYKAIFNYQETKYVSIPTSSIPCFFKNEAAVVMYIWLPTFKRLHPLVSLVTWYKIHQ